MVRVAGPLPEVGLTDSQLLVLEATAVKLALVPGFTFAVAETAAPPTAPVSERASGFRNALASPVASTVTGIVSGVFAAPVDVIVMLLVLRPPASLLVSMVKENEPGVLVVDGWVTTIQLALLATVKGRDVPRTLVLTTTFCAAGAVPPAW
jgi:hypothetical protein